MSELSQELQQWSLLHFEKGVPICDINVRKENKDRLARVSHVYWLWKKNPFINVYELLRQLAKGKYADAASETHAAQKDKMLFDFVVDHVSPPSRALQTAKVRAVADKLMMNGMQTDNGKDMAEGAKIAMKLDRLDQPEDTAQDFSKVAFLPSVVVTDVHEVDESKQAIPDDESRRIAAKYGATIDEKRIMIEEKVATMEAAAGPDDTTGSGDFVALEDE